MRYVEVRRHTMRYKPGQHLSQAGVSLARRVGAEMGPFERVITSTIPRAYETAIAMGFAVHEQLEDLSVLDDGVEAEVSWDAGFAAFARAAADEGAVARASQRQARFWQGIAGALSDDAAALLITHGGFIELGAVGCLPGADHESWGGHCSYCEGVRLAYDAVQFVDIEILRVT
jgi:broad specificity phosphatase PhoE